MLHFSATDHLHAVFSSVFLLYHLCTLSPSSLASSSFSLRSFFHAFVPVCVFFPFTSPERCLSRTCCLLLAFSHYLSLDSCWAYPTLETERASYCSWLILELLELLATLHINGSNASTYPHYFRYIHWWCFGFHWDLSLSHCLSLLFPGDKAVVLAVKVLTKSSIQVISLTSLSLNFSPQRMYIWTKEMWASMV